MDSKPVQEAGWLLWAMGGANDFNTAQFGVNNPALEAQRRAVARSPAAPEIRASIRYASGWNGRSSMASTTLCQAAWKEPHSKSCCALRKSPGNPSGWQAETMVISCEIYLDLGEGFEGQGKRCFKVMNPGLDPLNNGRASRQTDSAV